MDPWMAWCSRYASPPVTGSSMGWGSSAECRRRQKSRLATAMLTQGVAGAGRYPGGHGDGHARQEDHASSEDVEQRKHAVPVRALQLEAARFLRLIVVCGRVGRLGLLRRRVCRRRGGVGRGLWAGTARTGRARGRVYQGRGRISTPHVLWTYRSTAGKRQGRGPCRWGARASGRRRQVLRAPTRRRHVSPENIPLRNASKRARGKTHRQHARHRAHGCGDVLARTAVLVRAVAVDDHHVIVVVLHVRQARHRRRRRRANAVCGRERERP